MTELEALREANKLNMTAKDGDRYWACVVLYNWVIWRAIGGSFDKAEMFLVKPKDD